MRIATAWSTNEQALPAFAGAYARLRARLGTDPSLLLVCHTEAYEPDALLAALEALPASVRVHGASSCLGVMTEEGYHGDDGRALGLWGLADADAEASVGVGIGPLLPDARQAAIGALDRALAQAGRPGELPDLVWISASPGQEEEVLEGLRQVLGDAVPVLGGTCADNGVAGRWSLLTRDAWLRSGVVVTVLYTGLRCASSFQSGYSPTHCSGRITEAQGRVLHRIDGRPAAEVYDEWTGGLIRDALAGGVILPSTSLYPLGRVAGTVGHIPVYKLSHPDAVLPGGALSLFTRVEAGEEVVLMQGSPASLLTRAARVTDAALEFESLPRGDLEGALVVYCGGCMLTVRDDMARVVEGLNRSLDGRPFLGTFTFGEQGSVASRQSVHGNLMISSLVFSRGAR
ncbi:FIST signal transduction protein [Caldimonas tepidiphila]|uniref:FIST signal transduction protein n=1 Tax=Caldimonas tepidiphila TaxID=2315841 RepID=UPI000E5BC790|nr:FIST N-terminal domain-containing protein [Caldimonas tepidiphila]